MSVASFRTYGFEQPLGTDRVRYSSLLSQYLKTAAARELEARGYRPDPAPDFLVNFNVQTTEKLKASSTPSSPAYGGYYGYRRGYYGAWPGYETTTVTQYTEGTLSIDVVNVARKQLVWEGTVVGRLRDGGRPLDDASTLGDVAVISTSVQNRNIGLRLNSLRGGLGGGISVSGLSLAIKGDSVPLGSMLTGLLGGGASADPSRAFGKLGLFVNGQGSFGDQGTTLQSPGYDFSTAGLTAGADCRFTDNVVVGAAFGYLRTKIDRAGTVSDSSINGYSLSVYGTYYIKDQFYVDSILTYGRNDYGIDRRSERLASSGSGTTVDRITASTDGDQFSASASGGYDFRTGGLSFGPTGRVTYIRVHIDGFSEHGPVGSNAARIQDQTVESLTTALGGQATYAISTAWAVLLPLVSAEWEHELKGDRRVLAGRLVSSPATLLTAQASAPDRNYFNLGVGVTATFPRGISAFVHYEEQLGRAHFTNHSFTGGVRFAF